MRTFSIIIPIYNCSRFLPACLDSVLRQTYRNWECLCVDDGSQDESGAISDNYAERDCRIRVIHQVNQGAGAARNTGLRAFTGDWVLFLDADDLLNEHVLEVCDGAINKNPNADMVSVKHCTFVDGQKPKWEGDLHNIDEDIVDIADFIDKRAFGLSVWRVAYKGCLAKKVSFIGLKIGEDRVYWANILEEAHLLVNCSYVGYGYRLRIGSAVNSRMTTEKFLHDLRHHMEWVSHFVGGHKRYADDIKKGFVKELCEYMAYQLFSMNRKDRQLCFDEWCRCIIEVRHRINCSRWFRLSMKIVGCTKSQLSARVLFFFPYWLKAHGVNRGFVVIPKSNVVV